MNAQLLSPELTADHVRNLAAERRSASGDRQRAVLEPGACRQARAAIASWPGYAETPLKELPGLAAAAGVDRIWYKDEAGRFGLGSFKSLGGAYAVSRILIDEIASKTGERAGTGDLLSNRYAAITRNVTVTCATDGNHGRSVAWGARQFGCRCVIYIHATVSEGRKDAIEGYGAEVVRTAGNYDDSVREADEDAKRLGRIVVSDTSYPGYMRIPQYVMQGYTMLASEAIERMPEDAMPTHVFLQGGVGGFAAAVISTLWEHLAAGRPRMVIIEPDKAACIFASVAAGKPTAVSGDLGTVMAGLACGEISLLAWEILAEGADDVLMVADQSAVECMRLLADGVGGDEPVVAGESAVTGLAGLLIARRDPALCDALALGPRSRVLLIGTEGATDPQVYEQIVGRPASQVAPP